MVEKEIHVSSIFFVIECRHSPIHCVSVKYTKIRNLKKQKSTLLPRLLYGSTFPLISPLIISCLQNVVVCLYYSWVGPAWTPPDLCLKCGGLQLSRHGCLQSWSPPISSTSLGGLRWPEPAIYILVCRRPHGCTCWRVCTCRRIRGCTAFSDRNTAARRILPLSCVRSLWSSLRSSPSSCTLAILETRLNAKGGHWNNFL